MGCALVLGGADCIWADVEAALLLGEFDAVVTCNDITARWPGPIAAAASLHAEKWQLWLAQRDRRGYARPERLFGHAEFTRSVLKTDAAVEFTARHFDGQRDSGSSGLFAAKVALEDLGHDRAVLCGVPMTAEARHFFDNKPWNGAVAHIPGWRQARPSIAGRLRSMSGWTQTFLGEPTADWIAGLA